MASRALESAEPPQVSAATSANWAELPLPCRLTRTRSTPRPTAWPQSSQTKSTRRSSAAFRSCGRATYNRWDMRRAGRQGCRGDAAAQSVAHCTVPVAAVSALRLLQGGMRCHRLPRSTAMHGPPMQAYYRFNASCKEGEAPVAQPPLVLLIGRGGRGCLWGCLCSGGLGLNAGLVKRAAARCSRCHCTSTARRCSDWACCLAPSCPRAIYSNATCCFASTHSAFRHGKCHERLGGLFSAKVAGRAAMRTRGKRL